jgi:hypothetical protein
VAQDAQVETNVESKFDGGVGLLHVSLLIPMPPSGDEASEDQRLPGRSPLDAV